MTPLIDVTFLLIIFALLISHFVQQEEKLLRLPKADQAHDTKERLPRKLIVSVSRSGVVSIGGQSQDIQTLESLFRGARAKNPNVSVQLRADGDMNYERVQQILRRCAQAGIWRVSFAVNKESEDLKPREQKHDPVH
jgi:biopolymer transport protein ExbD